MGIEMNRNRYLTNKEKPMLTWDAAVQAMKDEGYGWAIERRHNLDGVSLGYRPGGKVESTHTDPTAAINDLLTKCRERWPAKHPWDDLSLDELTTVCWEKAWRWHVMDNKNENLHGREAWAFWRTRPVREHESWCDGFGPTPADALRSAMKAREAAGR